MTRTTDRVRAVFLAVLMVLSVFGGTIALSGSAAAVPTVTGGSGPLGIASDAPGGVEYYNGSYYRVQIAFNRSIGNPGNHVANITGVNTQGRVVTTGNVSLSSSAVNIKSGAIANNIVTVTLGQNNRMNLVQDASITLYDTVNGTQIGTFDITTTSASVDIANVVAGTDSNATVYQGERLAVFNNTNNTRYEVFRGGAFQFSGATGPNSTVAFEDTGDLQTGTRYRFVVVGSDGDTVQTPAGNDAKTFVDVRNLGLDVTLTGGSSFTIPQGQTVNVTFNADVSSNVAGRFLAVEILDADGDTVSPTVATANDRPLTVRNGVTYIDLDQGGADREQTVSFTIQASSSQTLTLQATDLTTGITAESSGTVNITTTTGQPTFDSSVYTETRGNYVQFTIDLGGVRSAYVQLGSTSANYYTNFTVQESQADADSLVTVRLNTYQEGWNPAAGLNPPIETNLDADLVASGSDSITNYNVMYQEPGDPLDAGSYNLNVSLNPGGTVTDVATVDLRPESLTSATTMVAPRGSPSETSQQNSVARGDLVMVQFTADGFDGFLNTGYNFNKTANGRMGFGVYVAINQTDTDINQNPAYIYPGSAGVSVSKNNASNTITLTIDTRQVRAYRGPLGAGNLAQLQPGQTYRASLIINGNVSPYVKPGKRRSVSTTFNIEQPSVRFNNLNSSGILTVSAVNQVTVGGTTSLAPGTNYTVRVQSTTTGVPFLLTKSGEVTADGTWGVTFNMSEVPAGTTFQATFVSQSNVQPQNRQVQGLVMGQPQATVTFNDQESNGEVVTVSSVTMTQGGFVAIHEGSAGGPVIGSSKYLEPGTHENVRIALDDAISSDATLVAMPHLDTNDNQVFDFGTVAGEDLPYTTGQGMNATPVTDSASIDFVEGGTVTVTRTQRVTETVVQTQTRTVVQTREVTRTVVRTVTQTGGQPGFGIAAAVAALLAAALLALRRRD